MGIARCSDEDFIALWNRVNSAAAVAKALDINLRAVQLRRRNLERKYGIRLAATDKRSPDVKVTIPGDGVRTTMDIENGIIVVASDCHYWPGIVSTAHRAFVKMIGRLRPQVIIMNGDVFDGAGISRHDPIGWQSLPNVKQELEAAQERLTEIERAAKGAKLHWTWGNHDLRFNTRLASQVGSAWDGVYGFNLKDHFPLWNFSTSVMVNGALMIKHRWHNGVHALWNNVMKSGVSMCTGHLHALGTRSYTDYNGTRYAIDTGTLAQPTGEQFTYMEDSPANHRSGFAVLTIRDGRLMPPEICEVISEDEGLVFFRGEIINVNEESKMPTKSAKQEKLMQAVAHNKAFAKKVGIPQSVGKEMTKGKSHSPSKGKSK